MAIARGPLLLLALVPGLGLAAGCGGTTGFASAYSVSTVANCQRPTAVAAADLSPGVTDAVRCTTLKGHPVVVDWFQNQDMMDRFKAAMGKSDAVAWGSDWAVECPSDPTGCAEVVKSVDD